MLGRYILCPALLGQVGVDDASVTYKLQSEQYHITVPFTAYTSCIPRFRNL